MTIYLLLALCLSLLCLFRNCKWIVWVVAILLIIIAGFRAESVGTDTQNYENLFEWYGDELIGASHANEPGYALLQLLVVRSGLSYRAMAFICQMLIIILLSLYARKVCHHPQYLMLCYLLLYFYFYSFNTTRQYIAIPFLLFAYECLDKGNTKQAILLIICATMFHNAAFIGFLVLIFKRWHWSPSLQIILLATTFIIGITSIPQVLSLGFASYMPIDFVEDYVLRTSDYRELGFSLSRFLLTGFSILLVVMLKNNSNRLCIMTLGICILNLFAFQPVVARMAQCFTIIQITIIPEISYMIRSAYKRSALLIRVVAFIYMTVVFLYLLSANVADVVPYVFGGFHF